VAPERAVLPGDRVQVQARRIAVNGMSLPNSFVRERDSAGKPVEHVAWGEYRVAAGEVWLFGLNDRRSSDSRYFGPVALRAIRGVAQAVVT
jgi:signal peptidase I